MPVYEFKSPDGVSYYGEGASPEEAFRTAEERDPTEIAAMRTRQSVRHGAAPPDIEIPEAAQAVKRGDYGPLREQAFSAVGDLASTVFPGLAAIGSAIAPTATAESMFAAEPDAAKRRALERQYKDAGPKGQRDILRMFNEQQGKIAEERRAVERETAERGETQKRRDDWMAQNAEAIKSLSPLRQQQIQGAASLPEAQEMFNRGIEDRRQAGMTIAERYPLAVGGLEAAGMVGGALLPGKLAAGRARAIKEATSDAEEAFRAAWGPGAKGTKGRKADADLAENILKRANEMGQFSATEMAGGIAAPWIMGQMPNFYDMVIGQLSSDPGAQEKVERAWNNVLSLGPLERALIEGGAATALGTWMGSGRRDFGATKGRAQGVLDTFEGRRAAEQGAAAAKAQRAKELQERRKGKPVLVSPAPSAAKTDVLSPGGIEALSEPYDFGYGAN